MPSIAAISTALAVSAARPSAVAALERGVILGALLGAIALLSSLVHGARVGFCDAEQGVLELLLGPGCGAVMGGAWGAGAGLVVGSKGTRRRRIVLSVLGGLLGPLAGVLISLWRFWSSPMVFAFDPFFGFFAGPLYDTVIEPVGRLETYRVGSLFTLIAAGAFCFHLERDGDGFRLVGRGRPALAFLGLSALAGSLWLTLAGSSFGHWSTPESIEAELERSVAGERCDVRYAPSIAEHEAKALGRDCDAHVRLLERWFEAKGPERIRVWVFESEAQKGRLMGAASTYIAKPWRREVYVQFARYPHPVLGHELAHVVAGSFGAGPFRVSGPLGGLWPDPGRIEGIATAAAPSDDPDLTLAEWSRAMLELGLLPPLEAVFRLSFLGENSSKAYTVAGAFVEWLREVHGAAAVRGWYAGQPLSALTGGKDLAALERDWRASLEREKLSAAALEAARARFDRPAVFGRKCPHEVDAALSEAHGRLGQGDVRGARERFERSLALDPAHFGARLALGTCAARAGDDADARRRYGVLAEDPKLHKLLRLAAEEALADLDLARGASADAAARYQKIAGLVIDEDRLRTLDVKASATKDPARAAIAALLVGDPMAGRDPAEAAALLGEWVTAEPENGLPEYLLGRGAYNSGRYPEAARRLDRALDKKLALPRVEAEALRLRVVVACLLEDRTRGREALARHQALPGLEPAGRSNVERLGRRCGLQ